ncbi:MAG TPA: DUF2062 domain-containing protein [Paludibacteraceae bacterium]|nr:DUF2062 domain-containing protein [Paludibacteraceae bacterium]
MDTNVSNIKNELKEIGCCIIIPTFNNSKTIAQVVSDAKLYCSNIYVVNDGSTDETKELLSTIEGINAIGYERNKGKGNAIKFGFKKALADGFRYAITIDSDGQHYLSDIPLFLDKIKKHADALIVGVRNIQQENMPQKNTFANKFSNFWFKVETDISLPDTQCGFRLYPLNKVSDLKLITSRYEFELEVLVRSAWKGTHIIPQPIQVYYAPKEERVSHFHPFRDFTRISILNTFLVLIAFLWVKPIRFLKSLTKENIKNFFRENFTDSRESNQKLSSAVGLGIYMGIVPFWGYQMIIAYAVASLLKLNRWIALVASNISLPIFIPFILFGSYVCGGFLLGNEILPDFDSITLESILKKDLWQYILGSFVFATICGILAWVITFLLLTLFRKKKA